MTNLDWILLTVTLLFIIIYGVYKNHKDKDLDGYLLGNQSLPWYHVGLSVMATQASAITFLSTTGQGFDDGMRFVQFYFGLPLAMIVLCVTFIPIFHRLKVYTAYEYLETRFDGKVRVFTAFLFLIQRGLSTGISIYAPAIILSTIFGWDIFWTNILMGGMVLTYTVVGGTKAISYTHLQQMIVITVAMFLAGVIVVMMLPENIGFVKALKIAGKAHHTNVVSFEFNPKDRYNLWSGLIGGFFLQLSYFGTDQSQVGRYLTGESITQSRLGLVMNGLLKVPMQFLILLVGVLVFVFYQYNPAPIFFNKVEVDKLRTSQYAPQLESLEQRYNEVTEKRKNLLLISSNLEEEQLKIYQNSLAESDSISKALKSEVAGLIKKNNPSASTNDRDYVFLRFVLDHLPHGLIGLLVAVIFAASMGSIASAYNSLAATSVVDVYRKFSKNTPTEKSELNASKVSTVLWGLFCIFVAQYANELGNMIEVVNVLGSLFYGIILGVFLVAFYFKNIGGTATFWAAVISQTIILGIGIPQVILKKEWIAYLWFNPIGCFLVIGIAWILQKNLKLAKV
ncbi:SSS sodium solute transporter superfamily [Emticicia oligotrophica DSM 17448]|uniref:SSS sodium solute transporter superfamily n=1 Tax=Emticicia oligotrophica (strain DSM 17448 / CIP 109782 / MTCC 6937 / GPTSA100-15) TaxID=929562 RepID=A0ABN4ABY4_EMTOG|nr:sodium:solute symporter [Emticicia oligotrophica]AFK01695.1 SSS sodium solute transporter superfamily [Emticicia oligotrophica DSM 17448]